MVDKYSANAADSATVVVLARGFLVARRLVVRVVVAAGVVSLLVAPVVRVPLAPSTGSGGGSLHCYFVICARTVRLRVDQRSIK